MSKPPCGTASYCARMCTNQRPPGATRRFCVERPTTNAKRRFSTWPLSWHNMGISACCRTFAAPMPQAVTFTLPATGANRPPMQRMAMTRWNGAAQLPDSDGQVCVWGHSYSSWAAWVAASSQPPHLKALFGSGMAASILNHTRGIFETGRRLHWMYQQAADQKRRAGFPEITARRSKCPLVRCGTVQMGVVPAVG